MVSNGSFRSFNPPSGMVRFILFTVPIFLFPSFLASVEPTDLLDTKPILETPSVARVLSKGSGVPGYLGGAVFSPKGTHYVSLVNPYGLLLYEADGKYLGRLDLALHNSGSSFFAISHDGKSMAVFQPTCRRRGS